MQSIVVDVDGVLMVATNGQLGGNQKYANIAKRNSNIMKEVRLVEPYGDLVTADLDPENPLGITAAMMSIKPGRSRVLDAPRSVLDWLIEQDELYGETIPDDGAETLETIQQTPEQPLEQ